MSDSQNYKTLEAFFLAEKKEDFIKTLIPGTESHSYFSLLHGLNQYGANLPADLEAIRKNFERSSSLEAQSIKLRTLLLSLDTAKTPEERTKILKQINSDFLYFDFSHPQPSNIAAVQLEQGEAKLSDKLDETLIKPDEIVQKNLALNTEQKFRELHSAAYKFIDLNKFLANAKPEIIQLYLQKADIATMPDLVEFHRKYTEKKKKLKDQIVPLEESFLRRITLTQLKEFLKKDKDLIKNREFFSEYFNKRFKVSVTAATAVDEIDKKLRRERLIEMYRWVLENAPSGSFESFGDQLLYEILQLGIEIDVYDKELFIKYLQRPKTQHSWCSDSINKKVFDSGKKSYESFWHHVHQLNTDNWIRDEDLIKSYLERFFQGADTFKPFDDYLRQSTLQEFFVEVKLRQGKQIPNVTDILSPSKIQEINNEKELKLVRTNKTTFGPSEEVRLTVDIKNIPLLHVKVFEINTENYYRKNFQEFQSDTNLDGLTPSEETVMEFKEPPVQRVAREFNFPLITSKKRGLFVIEFMGNGLSSRAIIKKGTLFLNKRLTSAGLVVKILDEEYNICKGETTGLWLSNRFYKVTAEGLILIPFAESPKSEKIIILHEGHAEFTSLQLEGEAYAFNCTYLYQQEQLLSGNTAKFIIKPALSLNGNETPLTHVESPNVTVTATSTSGIPTTTTFDKIKFENNRDIEIDYPVPAKVQSLEIVVKCKIKKMLGGKDEELTSQHGVPFINYEDRNQFVNIHLRKTKQSGYEIYALGKNGEPKVNMSIALNIVSIHTREQINAQLATNKEGFVSLGQLQDVQQITANLQGSNEIQAVGHSWIIQQKTNYDYPDIAEMCEGDTLRLPLSGNQNEVYLLEGESSNVIEDLTPSLKFEDGIVVIAGLKEGRYTVGFKNIHQSVTINVLAGKYWNKSEVIITKTGKMKNASNPLLNNMIFFKSIEQVGAGSPGKEGTAAAVAQKGLRIKIHAENRNQTRVHVFLTNFLPFDVNKAVRGIKKHLNEPNLQEIQNPPQWMNTYLSNRRLGDEYCYVLDRKKQQRFIGNTLERPHLLLKQTFIRDTTTEQESLAGGEEYARKQMFKAEGGAEKKKRKLMKKGMAKKEKAYDRKASYMQSEDDDDDGSMGSDYSGDGTPRAAVVYKSHSKMAGSKAGKRDRMMPKTIIPAEKGVDTLLNFLECSGALFSNLKADADGVIFLSENDIGKYSTAIVIALNEYTSVGRTVELDKYPIAAKDLRLKPKAKKDNFFSYARNASKLTKGEKVFFEDFTSTNFQVVDTISKLFDLQKELMKVQSVYEEDPYDQWSFLKDWGQATLEAKHKSYDKFACHELNIFLYYKDREYFDEFVKPFLQNKIEKTFVDHFLLDLEADVKKYLKPNKLAVLNVLEKILLATFAARRGLNKEAAAIADYLVSANKLAPVPTNQFKQYFDTVLNAKKAEGEFVVGGASAAGGFGYGGGGPGGPMGQMFMAQNMVPMAAMSNIMPCAAPPPMAMEQQMEFMPMRMMNRAAPRMRNRRSGNANKEQAEEEEENCCEGGLFGDDDECCNNNDDFDNDFRNQIRQGYQAGFMGTEKPKEYCERSYYKVADPFGSQWLVNNNSFWADLAAYVISNPGEKPFLTGNFMYAVNSLPERLAVLAFLSLPFQSESHKYQPDKGRGLTFEASSNAIVFHKEIKECQAELRTDIILAQRFFDPLDRYELSPEDPTIQTEKAVTEFLINKVYACQVIVTNCSVVNQEVQVLHEVPVGALPVRSIEYTRSNTLTLNAFTTSTLEYFFYFPAAGSFTINPANVSKNGKVLAMAQASTFDVKTERTQTKMESLNDVLNSGSKADIITFIKTKNIFDPNLFSFHQIAWLLKDKEFYNQIIQVCRDRQAFDQTVWQYSILHGDIDTVRDLFEEQQVQQNFGSYIRYIKTSTITISSVRVLEYFPMVNSRYHMLPGVKSNIMNVQFREQYTAFMKTIVEKAKPDATDLVVLVYYLLLQDRIDEATKIFAKITRDSLPVLGDSHLQFDYCAAYLDFYTGAPNFKLAREISAKYLDYPILSWRRQFIDIANQLAEYDGEELIADANEADQQPSAKNARNASKEEVLSIELNGSNLIINYQNIQSLTINFFEIDLEILFSRNPFLLHGLDDFSFVKPTRILNLQLEPSAVIEKKVIAIPEDLAKKNVSILAASANQRATTTYFSTKLSLQMIENYGQVKVLDSEQRPLSQVYVKTFARFKDGKVAFYKDGYTDLRGRFDYAALNTGEIDKIDKFALFVMSDELGSLIKEAIAPAKVGRFEDNLQLRSKKAQIAQQTLLKEQEQRYVVSKKSKY